MTAAGRALAAVTLAAASGCVADGWDDPVTADEVITRLEIKVAPGGAAVADGRSRLVVELETAGVAGRDVALTAKLVASDGRWSLPDTGTPLVKTVNLQDPTFTAELIAGTTPGPLFVSATVKSFTREDTIDLAAPAVEDVIPELIVTPATGAVADGVTPVTVHVCTSAVQAATAMSQVELRTSDGRWALATSGDPKVLTLPLAGRCVDAALVPGTTPQTLAVSATIGRFTRAIPVALGPATIASVTCGLNGTTSPTTGAGTIALDARMFAANGGKPSVGTRVTYQATVTPATAGGYFERPEILLESGDRAASSFVTFGHPTRIVFTASASAGGGAPVACAPVTFDAP